MESHLKDFQKQTTFFLVLLFQLRCSYQGNSRMNKLTKTNCKELFVYFVCAFGCSFLLDDGGF